MADSDRNPAALRPLLPQPFQAKRDSTPVPTKKPRIKQACEACRQSKSKCSGDLPNCKVCVNKDLKCRYVATPAKTRLHDLRRRCNDLQSRSSPYEEFFRLLKTVSEQQANDVLAKVREGTEVETLLRQITDGDLLLQLSVVPESCFRYDFPYILQMPKNLVSDDNPYLQSIVYDGASINASLNDKGSARKGQEIPNSPIGGHVGPQSSAPGHLESATYLRPFHAAEVIDVRVSQARFTHWTSVCEDDVLMRDLLGTWLHCEYQFTAAFHKDLFLDDLVNQREEFCSSLLVNIVLGYACICYGKMKDRAEYWNPRTLTYRFLAEAKRLWEFESHQLRLTTVQAGILFNVFYNLSGLDELGQSYRLQALNLARQMDLFSARTEHINQKTRVGMSFTAWALYNWETLVGFSFVFAPLLSKPPDWPLPGTSAFAEWYGEIWAKYPRSRQLEPSHLGDMIKARSQFRCIKNEACQVAWSNGSEMTLVKAMELFTRLQKWFDTLPASLHPKAIVLPGQLQLHIYYHHLIITIFKPLIDINTNQNPSPQQIVADATKYLHTLVRLYYLRHGYEAMDLFIVIPLMLVATDCIDTINDQSSYYDLETLRSTLILATKGLFMQRRNHYLARTLFRVIRGRMRPTEVALFRNIMNIDADQLNEEPNMAPMVRSSWPVSVVQKKDEVDAYILKNLVENYAHLNAQ